MTTTAEIKDMVAQIISPHTIFCEFFFFNYLKILKKDNPKKISCLVFLRLTKLEINPLKKVNKL